jgi:SAM-dependent methyltransferase
VHEGDLRGRRVLEVGCGTGQLATALVERTAARVWAVDPEPAMVDAAMQRVPRGVELRCAPAERLPFGDAAFERAAMRLVVHLLDRSRALPELRRVLASDGRAAIATFDAGHFERSWLRPYFPSVTAIDAARFPEPAVLEEELRAAGFGSARTVILTQERTIDRDQALERIRGRHISTFDLLDPDELAAGTERAERELLESVTIHHDWAIVVADA